MLITPEQIKYSFDLKEKAIKSLEATISERDDLIKRMGKELEQFLYLTRPRESMKTEELLNEVFDLYG